MARIRSIHPGFATDEDLITVSRDARLFFLLLLTECDDQGVFEWKPKTLRMRIFPADDVDVETLLAELVSINKVRPYEIGGRHLGAVRNFRRYQRPKSPKSVHLITPQIRNYVGLSAGDAETVADDAVPFPPNGEMNGHHRSAFLRNGEISPQMEEGGGRRRKKDATKGRLSQDRGESLSGGGEREIVDDDYPFDEQTVETD